MDLLRTKADDDVVVKILIGMDYPLIEKALESVNGYRNIELRYKSIQTKLTTIVTDRELSLNTEEKSKNMENLLFTLHFHQFSQISKTGWKESC